MNQRQLRSSSRNQANSDINTSEPTTTSVATSATQTTTNTVSTNVITPLLSIRFPPETGPNTHSSPESEYTITTPTYSRITARGISGQESDTVRRNTGNMSQQDRNLPTVSEERNTSEGLNREIISIREYVSASVEAAQASIMREVQNMQLMIPQLIRESLRSEQGNSLENPNNQNRSFYPNTNYQTPFNHNHRQTAPNPQFNPPNFQQRQPTIPQQLFGNDSRNFSHPSQDFNPQQYPQNYKPITPNQLDKWGLKFDGSSKVLTVEDFVFRVELLRNDYNCPWDILMKGFHHLVTGTASTWFWTFRMQNPTADWHTLKYHLIRKFRNFESDFEIQRRIMERRQAPNETTDCFITEIIKLKNQMRVHVDETELVKIVKDNLKDGLAQLVFPIRIFSLDHLLEECKRAERNIAKRSSHRMPLGNPRKIYEVEMYEEPVDEQVRIVEAMQKEKLPAKQLVCWNCKAPGHSFIECPVVQRNVFCYRCGFDGVTSPTCPRCVGNTKSNTRKTGPACSSQNIPQ